MPTQEEIDAILSSVDALDLDDPALVDSKGFPSETKRRAIIEQHFKGVHAWGDSRVGRSIWNADGPNRLGGNHAPYIYDTALDKLSGLLSSGAGPRSDMIASLRKDRPVATNLLVANKAIVKSTETGIFPITVDWSYYASGTVVDIISRPIRYIIGVKVALGTAIGGYSTWYGRIESVATSNCSVSNGSTDGANTLIFSHDFIDGAGQLVDTIGWFTDGAFTTPVSGGVVPTYDDITSINVWIKGAYFADTDVKLFDGQTMGTATITIATPGVVTLNAHGLVTGNSVYLTTTGALPTGLTASTNYYVIKVTDNTFRLAASYTNAMAGTAIATSGTQSGTHSVYQANSFAVGEPVVSIRETEDSAWYTTIGTSSTNQKTIDFKNATTPNRLEVIVAPLLATSSLFQVSVPWESERVSVTSTVNDTWNSGNAFVKKDALVTLPLIVVPSHVSSVVYNVAIEKASAKFGQDLSFVEQEALISQTGIGFAEANGTVKTPTPLQCTAASLATYPKIKVWSMDGSSNATTYRRLRTAEWEGASVSQEVPPLSIGESYVMDLSRYGFEPPPVGAESTGYRAWAETDGFTVTISDEVVVISRVPHEKDLVIELSDGWYWIKDRESFHYTELSTMAFPEGDSNVTITGIKADTLIDVPGYSYRFDYDNESGDKTFDVTYYCDGTGYAELWLPHRNISSLVVSKLVDGNYVVQGAVFSETEDGPCFVLDDASQPADEYRVTYHLDESFYVKEGVLYVSEPVPAGGITVQYQAEDDSPESTSVSLASGSIWDDRFFIAFSDEDQTVATAEINFDRSILRSGILPGGIIDAALVYIEVKDADGVPIQGAAVTWADPASGRLSGKELVTNFEGRACAYLSCSGNLLTKTDVTITATVASTPYTGVITVNPEIGADEQGYEWLMFFAGPSAVRYGVAATFNLFFFDADGAPSGTDCKYRLDFYEMDKEGNYILDSSGDIKYTQVTADKDGTVASDGTMVLTYNAAETARGLYVYTIWLMDGLDQLRKRYITWRVY